MMSSIGGGSFRSWSVGFLFLLFVGTGFAQPRLIIDKTKIDLGVIYNGATKKARVVLKNVGRDTLRILGVTTSCGCTTARQPKAFLRTGESDAVEVEFNSTGFRGKIEKHVTIMTNDPAAPSTFVTLLGDVIDELQPVNNSAAIWLGSVPVGKQVEQTVSFKNVSGKVITVTGYKSSSPDIVVTFSNKTVLPADTIRMTVKVTPRKADYLSELLLFETDSKKQNEVPVRVTLFGVTPN